MVLKERDIEKYLIKQVKELGGEIRKVSWQGRRGAPDRLVMMHGWSAFVELKAPDKKPTAQQYRELDRMRQAGLDALWINSIGGVDRLLGIED